MAAHVQIGTTGNSEPEPGHLCHFGRNILFPEIAHTEFTGNHRSVFFSAMKLGSIKNCTITTGPVCAGGSYGVYLDRSTGYTIEENVFYQGNDAGIGMVINKSGGAPNQIYRNEFDGLKFGIVAQNNIVLLMGPVLS
ncbi:MAG: right-handed parallel beta-helix repeat-containing protein [Bacteroidales bacterium]